MSNMRRVLKRQPNRGSLESALVRTLALVYKESVLKVPCKPLLVKDFFCLPSDETHGTRVKAHLSQVITHGKWEKNDLKTHGIQVISHGTWEN